MKTSDKSFWLFNLLRQYPEGLTREEIGQEYYNAGFPTSSVTLKDGRSRNEIPRETFNRIKKNLKEKFGVEVVCTPSTYKYRLAANYEDSIDKTTLWMLDSYQTIKNVRENDELRNRVIMDGVPIMGQNVKKVMQAIRERCTITLPSSWIAASIEWCDFTWLIADRMDFNPYGLRNYEGKWYVVGVFDKIGMMNLYNHADRYDERNNVNTANIEAKYRPYWVIEVLENPLEYLSEEDALFDDAIELSEPNQYEIPEWFDIEKIYKDFVGPDIVYDMPKKEIILKANHRAAIKLNSNPIHHSQDILKEESEATYFFLYLRPSKYFFIELMKHGNSIEIVEPNDLKEAYESIK